MAILGYETGEILAKAAMTSDFELVGDIPNQVLVDQMEIERRSMDIRPGMNRKYSPLGYHAEPSAYPMSPHFCQPHVAPQRV